MTYVMSDIHGEFFKFKKMLEQISFSDSDTLYILGDVIDRGQYPIRTLLYIIEQPNIKMLIGNHEELMVEGYFSHNDRNFSCWMYNGGEITFDQYIQISQANKDKIKDYLLNLPLTYELDDYILVHAGYTKERFDREFCIWAREEFLDVPTNLKKKVIFGHTPTSFITGQKKDMSIWCGSEFKDRIGIDCGCCFKGGRLACLRLDDMQEFYV